METNNSLVRIIGPGQVEAPAAKIRFLFLPGRGIFARRAGRFRCLSDGNPLGDYFSFLALLSDAQQTTFDQFPPVPLSGPEEQALCHYQGMPLLGWQTWRRDPAWRWGLEMVLQQMKEANLPKSANETITGLLQAGETALEEKADRILAGDMADISARELPFIAAALQVYWVHMASSLDAGAFAHLQQGGLCPVCGSHPNAGIVGAAGERQGLRYLSCSLCSSQWHMVRLKCSDCGATEGISFYTLEGSNGAVKAESCNGCDSYLKLLYLGKDHQMDAMADDLATLALDMLMDEQGKARKGANLFFHPGDRADSKNLPA